MKTVKKENFKSYLLRKIDGYFRDDFESREQLSRSEYVAELLILVKSELELDCKKEDENGSK